MKMENNNDFLNRSLGRFNPKGQVKGKIVTEIVKRGKPELKEQLVFCKYIKIKYPDIIYRSDESSDGWKSFNSQNVSNILQSGPGFPDVQIYEPRGNYVGIMIEVKKKVITRADSIWKLNGELKTNEHLFEQAEMHDRLRNKGWFVKFAQGADEAIKIFEEYLAIK